MTPWARGEGPRVRWRHLAGSPRAAAVPPAGNGQRGANEPAEGAAVPQPAPLAGGQLEDARTELATVIAAFAETAFTTREQAERDAERIRREADAYAESRRAEAERVLQEARRQAEARGGLAVDEG